MTEIARLLPALLPTCPLARPAELEFAATSCGARPQEGLDDHC